MRTTGSDLLFTSLIGAAGFSVFAFSEMTNIRVFGLLSSFAAPNAFLADILVGRALLSLVEGFRHPVRFVASVARGVEAG